MLTLIAAAVLAAQSPAVPTTSAPAAHADHAQKGDPSGKPEMDCCKECCADMKSKMHDGHAMKGMDGGQHQHPAQ